MSEAMIKVLVIDDEESLCVALSQYLTIKKFKTFMAVDSDQALAIIEKEQPDICIIDIHLGLSPLDGLDILEIIKQRDYAAHCVMLTRITDEDSIQRAKTLGAVHYLLKPIDAQSIYKIIQDVANSIIKERTPESGKSPAE